MVGGRGRDRTGDPLLAKQVLSQLSYTPTVRVTFILKHFSRFQNPFPRILSQTVPKLFQNPRLPGLVVLRQRSFRLLGGSACSRLPFSLSASFRRISYTPTHRLFGDV